MSNTSGYQMTQLHKIISAQERMSYATNIGTRTHALLNHINTHAPQHVATAELAKKISNHPQLSELFSSNSKTEVPIAGTINGRFISRRIDRLSIDNTKKIIHILDYKTDIDNTARKALYVAQINEYASLLHAIYPTYTIRGYILWTHNFLLENIPIKPL